MSLETIDMDRLNIRPGISCLTWAAVRAVTAFLPIFSPMPTSSAWIWGCRICARQEAASRNFPVASEKAGSCNFVRGTGHTLPFPDNTFDQVICSEVLEHIPDYPSFLQEIQRVLKPGGLFAVSVPRYFPEWVCWQLSDAYHEVEGGHVRIFRANDLKQRIQSMNMKFLARHWAHSLHVPYWWLKCLFWDNAEEHFLVKQYHRLLVWDLMQQPWLTQTLDRLLNPILGKSVVMYFRQP